MFRYRIMIILAVIWLTLALNLERPDELFGLQNINIGSYVYVLGAVTMVVLLFYLRLVQLRTSMLIIPVLILYGISKVFLYDWEDFEAARFISITTVEVLGLVITIWIIQHLGRSINTFNLTIEDALIRKDKTQVMGTLEGETVMRRKIDQARRFNRPLTLLYIHLDESSSRGSQRHWKQEEKVRYMYLQTQLAELLTYVLKVTDVRVWHRNNLVVGLLETPPENATQTAQQIRQVLKDVLGIQAQIGVANFPADGLIYQHLIKHAMHNLVNFE